jgi:hypothetical protein
MKLFAAVVCAVLTACSASKSIEKPASVHDLAQDLVASVSKQSYDAIMAQLCAGHLDVRGRGARPLHRNFDRGQTAHEPHVPREEAPDGHGLFVAEVESLLRAKSGVTDVRRGEDEFV